MTSRPNHQLKLPMSRQEPKKCWINHRTRIFLELLIDFLCAIHIDYGRSVLNRDGQIKARLESHLFV